MVKGLKFICYTLEGHHKPTMLIVRGKSCVNMIYQVQMVGIKFMDGFNSLCNLMTQQVGTFCEAFLVKKCFDKQI